MQDPGELDLILDRALRAPQRITCRTARDAQAMRRRLWRRRGRRPLRIAASGAVVRVTHNDPILRVEDEI
jgi:hypothetical protein